MTLIRREIVLQEIRDCKSFHRRGGGKRPTEPGNAGAALAMKTGVELNRNVVFGYGD